MPDACKHTLLNEQGNGNFYREKPTHPEELVPQRLEAAGLDFDYLNAVVPGLIAKIKEVCATCTDAERCRHDFELADANERVAEYCPNTPVIDTLAIERVTGKTY